MNFFCLHRALVQTLKHRGFAREARITDYQDIRSALSRRRSHLIEQPRHAFRIERPQFVEAGHHLPTASRALILRRNCAYHRAVAESDFVCCHLDDRRFQFWVQLTQHNGSGENSTLRLLHVVGNYGRLAISARVALGDQDTGGEKSFPALLYLRPQAREVVLGEHQSQNDALMLGESPRHALLVDFNVLVDEADTLRSRHGVSSPARSSLSDNSRS